MEKVGTLNFKFDSVKWLVIFLAISFGVFANYHWSEQPMVYRAIGLFLLFSATCLIGLNTEKGSHAFQYLQDARSELRKVVWPERNETIQTTFIVVAAVGVMSIFLWVVDAILFRLMSVFTG